MKHVALLRGINVGGKTRVEMSRLKQLFEKIGFTDVITYLNSGNIIFSGNSPDTKQIETAIEKEFGFYVPILLRSFDNIEKIVKAIPDDWVNNANVKCDVMFLWDEINSPDILNKLPVNPEIEDLIYVPGAAIWRVDRENINRGRMVRVVGSDTYKKMTIRNPNTVRKLYELMLS